MRIVASTASLRTRPLGRMSLMYLLEGVRVSGCRSVGESGCRGVSGIGGCRGRGSGVQGVGGLGLSTQPGEATPPAIHQLLGVVYRPRSSLKIMLRDPLLPVLALFANFITSGSSAMPSTSNMNVSGMGGAASSWAG